MELVPLDLSKAEKSSHPEFNETDLFLIKKDDVIYVGQFRKVWFGWHFATNPPWGVCGGFQFDAPGYNKSRWQEVYRIIL